MRLFYRVCVIAVLLTVLAVMFAPGLDDFVEQTFQRYLGSAAS